MQRFEYLQHAVLLAGIRVNDLVRRDTHVQNLTQKCKKPHWSDFLCLGGYCQKKNSLFVRLSRGTLIPAARVEDTNAEAGRCDKPGRVYTASRQM